MWCYESLCNKVSFSIVKIFLKTDYHRWLRFKLSYIRITASGKWRVLTAGHLCSALLSTPLTAQRSVLSTHFITQSHLSHPSLCRSSLTQHPFFFWHLPLLPSFGFSHLIQSLGMSFDPAGPALPPSHISINSNSYKPCTRAVVLPHHHHRRQRQRQRQWMWTQYSPPC